MDCFIPDIIEFKLEGCGRVDSRVKPQPGEYSHGERNQAGNQRSPSDPLQAGFGNQENHQSRGSREKQDPRKNGFFKHHLLSSIPLNG